MQTTATVTTGKAAKTWTLVWGWYTNASMLQRETFTSKRACWTRVLEIMAMRSESVKLNTGHDYVSVLQVWTDRADGKPGSEVSDFKVYTPGPWRRWGAWGVYQSKTTGEVFG